jgi:hypothetical protein
MVKSPFIVVKAVPGITPVQLASGKAGKAGHRELPDTGGLITVDGTGELGILDGFNTG